MEYFLWRKSIENVICQVWPCQLCLSSGKLLKCIQNIQAYPEYIHVFVNLDCKQSFHHVPKLLLLELATFMSAEDLLCHSHSYTTVLYNWWERSQTALLVGIIEARTKWQLFFRQHFQMYFFNENVCIWFKLYGMLFLRVQLTVSQHWLR